MAVDSAGNAFVTGTEAGDLLTVKYTPAGVEQWVRRFNTYANWADDAGDVALDAAGNAYVAGISLTAPSEATAS